MFKYQTGEDVQAGDIVQTGNHKVGIVKLVIPPGGIDGYDWACPEGGILIEEDWDGRLSLLAISVRAKYEWEDLTFMRRGHCAPE